MAGRDGEYEGEEPAEDTWEEGEASHDGRLELDEDERLPWLESADYEDEEPGVDTGRIVGFVLVALVVLAALLGGGWYLLNRDSAGEAVADGSTIEAPEGPYKERPENPGGRIAEGTGDIAPAIGEGETREGRLAESEPAPAAADGEDGDGDGGETNQAPAGVGVQVGAFSTRELAQRGWTTLTRQTDALSGVRHRVVEGQADIGKVYRLQAVADDVAAAKRLCDALQSDGVACQVKR